MADLLDTLVVQVLVAQVELLPAVVVELQWDCDVADGVGAALAWCALAVSLAAFVAQQVVG